MGWGNKIQKREKTTRKYIPWPSTSVHVGTGPGKFNVEVERKTNCICKLRVAMGEQQERAYWYPCAHQHSWKISIYMGRKCSMYVWYKNNFISLATHMFVLWKTVSLPGLITYLGTTTGGTTTKNNQYFLDGHRVQVFNVLLEVELGLRNACACGHIFLVYKYLLSPFIKELSLILFTAESKAKWLP